MVQAGAIMKTDLVTVSKETPIYDAIATMVDRNITGLPVIEDDMTLVGIITEKDVLSLLYNFEDNAGAVEDYMTENIISFKPDDPITDIAQSFKDNNFRRVPIVTEGKIIGVISRKDIISYVSRMKRQSANATA